MTKKVGDRVPDVTLKQIKDGEWSDIHTGELFANKKVAFFALPGAFTPTCSSTHLPGYLEHKKALNDAGIDLIVCLSVNDTFVMNSWAEDQFVDGKIFMLPDGNGQFSEEMGMLVDKSAIGFGKRSWRYSMVVDNGVIEKIFEEDRNEPGDPFKVSDAETMLNYLKS